jgi:toxin ParE1/3/4
VPQGRGAEARVRVVFTPRAERQIGALYDYIADADGEVRADKFVGRIVEFCLGLVTFPGRGAARDDVLPGLRIAGVDRRVTVAFMVLTDDVVIEGVFYGGQDWRGVLATD